MAPRHVRLMLVLGAFLAGLVLCGAVILLAAGPFSTQNGPQIAAIGGPFRLVNQNGQTVTDQDFKGRPFLVFFGFTHCPEICPTTLFEVSEIIRNLGPDGDRVRAIFITIDPERDTPAALKEYLRLVEQQPQLFEGEAAMLVRLLGIELERFLECRDVGESLLGLVVGLQCREIGGALRKDLEVDLPHLVRGLGAVGDPFRRCVRVPLVI